MSAHSSSTRSFHMIEAVPDRLDGAPSQLRQASCLQGIVPEVEPPR